MENEVQKEHNAKVLRMDLNLEMVLSFHHLLSNTEPRRRTEMRMHSKLFRELRKKCQDLLDEVNDTRRWKAGVVEYSDENVIDYFKDILSKKIDAGIPGSNSIGYNDLLNALEDFIEANKPPKKE